MFKLVSWTIYMYSSRIPGIYTILQYRVSSIWLILYTFEYDSLFTEKFKLLPTNTSFKSIYKEKMFSSELVSYT